MNNVCQWCVYIYIHTYIYIVYILCGSVIVPYGNSVNSAVVCDSVIVCCVLCVA